MVTIFTSYSIHNYDYYSILFSTSQFEHLDLINQITKNEINEFTENLIYNIGYLI